MRLKGLLDWVRAQRDELSTGLVVFVAGLFFLFLIWVLAASLLGVRISFGSLGALHRAQPLLCVVDLLPFVLVFFYTRLRKQDKRRVQQLEQELAMQGKEIMAYATFAKAIGDENYEAELVVRDEGNKLGRSLLRMRDNLKHSNQAEAERNWVTRGKDSVAYVLRLHTNLQELGYEVLKNLISYINVVQGGLYLYDEEDKRLKGLATYAYAREKYNRDEFAIGEGLIGQCAYEEATIYRTEIPDDYVTISSGILGDKKPRSLLLVPLITDEKLQGVLEFASIRPAFSAREIRFLEEVGEMIARTVFNLRINARTESLLREAQQMTQELRENEEELRQNAEEMQVTHEELERSNTKLEAKITETENAQKRLHSLLENASEVITIYNEQQQITYISPSVTKILGYTPTEMMDGKDLERLTQQGVNRFREMFDELMVHPRVPVVIQYVFMKKDGIKISMEVTGRNLLDDPAIQGIILNSRDITERVRAEKEERMKSKMQALSENSLDMIVRLSMDGVFYYANPTLMHFLGVSSDAIRDRYIGDVSMPESLREAFSVALRDVRQSTSKWEQEVTIEREKEEVFFHLQAIPEFEEDELETILIVGHDVTEAKRIAAEIQDKSSKITESINYAQRIQSSILPDTKLIQQYLPKSFMYYYPRDVVSGDFPWFFVKDDYLYIAAVDCTGHGVPGALLSFIGFFTLNNIVDHDSSYTAGMVLDYLHAGVRKTLRQDRPDADARDGMDIALCKINISSRKLEFSGAHRPLYHLRGDELTEYKGDRRAIGGIPNPRRPEGNFETHVIDLQPGDRVFFFSDGLPDQLGGDTGWKKYSPQRIREVIVSQRESSMAKVLQYFDADFTAHKGQWKQLDDVLLIGIEF